jgi:two-component system response regulator VicR
MPKTAKKILVVEDEKDLNDAYVTILTRAGYDASSAYNGREALDIVADSLPDLILLDLRMPTMGGLEFLEIFEASRPKKLPPIIVFSNIDTDKDIDEAYRYGAKRYILKAWATPDELLRVVKDTLKDDSKQKSKL